MENKDILGIGQAFGQSIPVKKLLSILEKFGGRAFKPLNDFIDTNNEAYKIKKLADAKAYEVLALEKANTSALVGRTEAEQNLLEKASTRLVQQEIRRQSNLDAISQIALDEVKDSAQIVNESINEDWAARFFSIAQDVSDDEMQQLWGRILSGEVKQPETYSVRTLELLKNINKGEAEVFTKMAKMSVKLTTGTTSIINTNNLEDKYNITFGDRLIMQELGLIYTENQLSLAVGKNGIATKFGIYQGDKGIFADCDGQNLPVNFDVIAFTKPGLELINLVHQESNDEHLKEIGHLIKAAGPGNKVKFGPIVKNPNGTISFPNAIDL